MDDGIRRTAAQRDRTWTARAAKRPDRLALWAVGMAVGAMLAAAATAHAGSGGVGTTTGGSGGGYNSASSSRNTRIWDGFNATDHHWAHRVGQCESGNDPRAIGGGGTYRGAFMFTRDAWKIPAKSPGGDPIRYTWKTQAVVAVLLKHKMGTKPWPVCG
jgi:hypothetical protein